MHAAFRRGGREAIDKCMKTQPGVFLKLLVLLVPRGLEVTHSQGVKQMSDEAIDQAIEAITDMLAKRKAGENAKVVEGEVLTQAPTPVASENREISAPSPVPGPPKDQPKPPRKRRARKEKLAVP
jgi:hypothetical protein